MRQIGGSAKPVWYARVSSIGSAASFKFPYSTVLSRSHWCVAVSSPFSCCCFCYSHCQRIDYTSWTRNTTTLCLSTFARTFCFECTCTTVDTHSRPLPWRHRAEDVTGAGSSKLAKELLVGMAALMIVPHLLESRTRPRRASCGSPNPA